jgi:hypothetical protein
MSELAQRLERTGLSAAQMGREIAGACALFAMIAGLFAAV